MMRIMPERLTVGRLMIGIALLALVLGAVLYARDNADVDRAMVTADLRALRQDDLAERRRAAGGLGMMATTDPASAASSLAVVVLGDPSPEVRQVASGSLGRVLVAWARGKPAPVRVPGTSGSRGPSLGDASDEASAVRTLLRAMSDPQAEVRHAAVEAFSRLQNGVQLTATLDAESFPALDRLLATAESGPDTRKAAVWCLARMVKPTPEGRARVLAILESDPDPATRSLVIRALSQGWPAADLYPIMLAHRRSAPTLEERSTVSSVLGNLPMPPAEVIPELIDLMRTEPIMAQIVPRLLGKLGRTGRPWLATLGTLAWTEVRRPDFWQALPAGWAVVQIDRDSTEAQALLEPLWRQVRQRPDTDLTPPDMLLAEFNGSAAALVPTLRVELRDSNLELRLKAARLLSDIGPPATVALPDLEAARSEHPDREYNDIIARLNRYRSD